MRSSHSELATWLLRRLGCSPKNESLIGDLLEQRKQGRSAVWYWRQVIVAIVVSLQSEIRAHKLLALRAVATGWAVLISSQFLLQPLRQMINPNPNSIETYYLLSRLLPAGWLDRYTGYYRWIATPLAVVLIGVIACAVGATSGWAVARLHRAHRRVSVLAYALSVAAYFFLLILYIVVRFGHGAVNALSVAMFANIMMAIGSILAGGGIFSLKEFRLSE